MFERMVDEMPLRNIARMSGGGLRRKLLVCASPWRTARRPFPRESSWCFLGDACLFRSWSETLPVLAGRHRVIPLEILVQVADIAIADDVDYVQHA